MNAILAFSFYLDPAQQYLRKGAYTLIWGVIFVIVAQGTLRDHPTLVASRGSACLPSELHIFAYF